MRPSTIMRFYELCKLWQSWFALFWCLPTNQTFFYFYLFFLLLLLDSSTKYYQDNKERVQKEACERCQSLSEEEKGKKAPKRSR